MSLSFLPTLEVNLPDARLKKAPLHSVSGSNPSSYPVDSSQKSTGSLIVAAGNPPVLLQFGKEVLNQVPPAVLVLVELPGFLLIRLRWNHCFHLVLLQAIQKPCFCCVGNVCQQGLDLIQKSTRPHPAGHGLDQD